MEPNMQPQKPVQAAVEDLQKKHSRRSGRRQKFFDALKE